MAVAYHTLVRETASAPGTGTVSLGGAASGRVAFGSVFSDAQTMTYVIEAASQAEWGIGTYNSAGNTLTRSTVLGNTSGTTSLVNFTTAVTVSCAIVTKSGGVAVDTVSEATSANGVAVDGFKMKDGLLLGTASAAYRSGQNRLPGTNAQPLAIESTSASNNVGFEMLSAGEVVKAAIGTYGAAVGGGFTSTNDIAIHAKTGNLGLFTAGSLIAVATATDFRAGTDNTLNLGEASKRWATVYAGTGTINTSDAREKTPVSALSEDEAAWAVALGKEIGTFKFLSAIAEKGNGARLHVGLTVQRAIELCPPNIDPMEYGFICFDAWVDGDGKDQSRYGFRYDELAMFILAGIVSRL